jgi:uncharacterized protein (DUF4415 family)
MVNKAELRRRLVEAGAKMEPGYLGNRPIDDEDNPEWTDEDFARAQFVEDLAPDLRDAVLAAFPRTKRRGAQKVPTKVAVSIRLSREVIDHFKAGGPGWQGRIDEALRKIAKG